MFLHYWFVESTNAPATDPVVVWMNGGPGCSSMEGFFFELGPLHFDGNRTSAGLPTLADNPFAWTAMASVIFVENPAGVGFSFYTNHTTATDDGVVSQNGYGFLKSWYRGFPEYSKNPLFLTGESYAGIYIPTLALRILDGAQRGDNSFPMQGFAVGNGCWGNAVGTCAAYGAEGAGPYEGVMDFLSFFRGHAMLSAPHWEELLQACGDFSTKSAACDSAVAAAYQDQGAYSVSTSTTARTPAPEHEDGLLTAAVLCCVVSGVQHLRRVRRLR